MDEELFGEILETHGGWRAPLADWGSLLDTAKSSRIRPCRQRMRDLGYQDEASQRTASETDTGGLPKEARRRSFASPSLSLSLSSTSLQALHVRGQPRFRRSSNVTRCFTPFYPFLALRIPPMPSFSDFSQDNPDFLCPRQPPFRRHYGQGCRLCRPNGADGIDVIVPIPLFVRDSAPSKVAGLKIKIQRKNQRRKKKEKR